MLPPPNDGPLIRGSLRPLEPLDHRPPPLRLSEGMLRGVSDIVDRSRPPPVDQPRDGSDDLGDSNLGDSDLGDSDRGAAEGSFRSRPPPVDHVDPPLSEPDPPNRGSLLSRVVPVLPLPVLQLPPEPAPRSVAGAPSLPPPVDQRPPVASGRSVRVPPNRPLVPVSRLPPVLQPLPVASRPGRSVTASSFRDPPNRPLVPASRPLPVDQPRAGASAVRPLSIRAP